MSFDVFLIGSTASPPEAQMERAVRAAIHVTTGRSADGDGVMQAADGAEFELFGGGMFALHGLTPSICTVIFRAAQRTNAFVVVTGAEGLPTLKIKGTPGRGPKDIGPIKLVADSQALCSVLNQGYSGWRGFADHAHQVLNPSKNPR